MSPSPRSCVLWRAVPALLLAVAVVLGGAPAAAGPVAPSPGPSGSAPAPGETDARDGAGADESLDGLVLPLKVTLRSLTPSTLPAPGSGGQVTLRGTVRNMSATTYEDVNVYPVLGDQPMTTERELRDAAALPVTAVVGFRDLTPGNFDDLGDLAPGETVDFTIFVGPDDAGLRSSGVYWLSAQALGAAAGERDVIADGRARTFITMLGDDPEGEPSGPRLAARQVDVSLVLPVRQLVRRDARGRLSAPSSWAESFAEDGRLGRLLAVGSESGLPPSWLIDPAVVDAALSQAQGDVGFPLTASAATALARQPGTQGTVLDDTPDDEVGADVPPATDDGSGIGSQESESPGDAGTAPEEPNPSDDPSPDDSLPGALTADAGYARPESPGALWLGRLGDALADQADRVDLLPYAEPDVSALAREDRAPLVREAFASTVEATSRLGIDGQLVLAPARGFVRPSVVAEGGLVDASVPLLLSQRAVRRPAEPAADSGTADSGAAASAAAPGSTLRTAAGHEVVLLSQGVRRGGPQPEADLSALGVRQRVLAEAMAALLSTSGTGVRPRLVAMPPDRWDPGAGWEEADLLGGLDVEWINSVPLPGAAIQATGSSEEPTQAPTDDPGLVEPRAGTVELRYPRRQAQRELGAGLVSTVADQVALAEALGAVLVENPDARGNLVRAALTGITWYVRGQELPAGQRVAGQAVTTLEVLRRVRLEVPSLVTMSSSSGSITVKIVNGLDQRVLVGIDARVASGSHPGSLVLDPPQPQEIPAEQQVTLRLQARAGQVGLSVVELRAASPDGAPVGLPAQVNVRASTLGIQIYRFMAAGGLVLLAVVVFRVRRRIRMRRATHGPLLSQEHR